MVFLYICLVVTLFCVCVVILIFVCVGNLVPLYVLVTLSLCMYW